MARVLVAEDEVLIRVDIVETLTEGGHTVVGEAGDGEQAMRLARELGPDLVVMDVKMPKVDGLTAARSQLSSSSPARVDPVSSEWATSISRRNTSSISSGRRARTSSSLSWPRAWSSGS